MNIATKYGIGDSVVSIRRDTVKLPPVACTACEGTGDCVLRSERFACPKCGGKKTTTASGYGWVVVDAGIVGNVRVNVNTRRGEDHDPDDPERDAIPGIEVSYMLTDSGTGTIHDEHSLWPTREDALAECDRRNDYARGKS